MTRAEFTYFTKAVSLGAPRRPARRSDPAIKINKNTESMVKASAAAPEGKTHKT